MVSFIIIDLVFLSLNTTTKRLTESECVLFWMVELCPGYVALVC